MSFRHYAGGGKRDASEPAIVEAIEGVPGARVWRIGGSGNPDLLVLYRDRYYPCEVKTGKGRLTKRQKDIPWPIVRTPGEALAMLGLLQ